MTSHNRSSRTPVRFRLLTLVLLGVALTAGVAGGSARAWAAPTPVPAPAPAAPRSTPSPIGPPPTATPSPTPPATPAPTPGPTGSGLTPPTDDSGDDPGFFDIPGQIRAAINDFIGWIAKTSLKPVMDTLGSTVLSTPDLTSNPQVTAVWTTSLVVANSVFVLFIVAGGFIVASRDTLQSRYGLKEIAPRIAVAGVAANVSLLVCGKAIEFANALTAAIAGQGVDGASAATAIEQMLDQPVNSTLPPVLFSLLTLAAVVMAIVVVITFILRAAMLVLLIGVAPLALTCHATPQTEGLAYTWWRALAACLGIQLGQAVIVLATVKVFLTPAGPEALGMPITTGGLVGLLVCVTMLWLLIKLPGWTRHVILGPLARHGGPGLVGQVIRAVVMLKTLGALASDAGRTSRPRPGTGTGTGTSGPRPSPGPGTAGPGTGTPRGGPRPPRPPRPTRPSPSLRTGSASPAAFSHAPTAHVPLSTPGDNSTRLTFSAATPPATPTPPPSGGVPPARFSDRPTPPPSPVGAPKPSSTPFSNPPTGGTPRRPTAAVPAVGFSAEPRPQTAPARPPAPVTPVFSAPSPPTPTTSVPSSPGPSTSPPRSTGPTRSSRADPPSLSPTPGRGPSPAAVPVPPPPSPPARSARPTGAGSVPPPARRRPHSKEGS